MLSPLLLEPLELQLKRTEDDINSLRNEAKLLRAMIRLAKKDNEKSEVKTSVENNGN